MFKLVRSFVCLSLLGSLTHVRAQDKPSDTAQPEQATADTAKKDEKKREVISVTGTRIKRMDMDVAVPVTVMGKEEIQASGKQTVTDIVKSLPSAVGNSVTTSTTNGGGGGSGNIALRGLDASSTLVLLNGRRLPLDASGSSPDLNSIPVAAIERIEVLQDGASAIYGSDAIAGVINIITRKDFEGLDFNLYLGQASRGDLETKSIDLTYGVGGDKGNLLLGVNVYSQGKVKSRDREVSKQALNPSSATPNSHVVLPDANGDKKPDFDGISKPSWTGDQATPDNFDTFKDPEDRFNFGSITDSIMAQNRESFFVGGDYALSDSVKGFFETYYSHTYSTYDMAPTPILLSQETGSLKVSTANPYNGFGQELSDVRKRLSQFGPRVIDADSDTIRSVLGLQGELASWNWDLAYNHGNVDVISTTKNIVNKTNLQLGLGDPAACSVVANLGCVPVNLLGPDGSLTPEMIDWLRINSVQTTETQVDSYTVNFTNNTIETGLGKLGLAFGAEVRGESYANTPDTNSQSYNTVGSSNGKATKGDRSVKEFYAELSIPVKTLAEIDFAARYSDYDDFGNSTNPKVGLKVMPLQGLTLRGSYSKGFRAPSLVELYQGQVENFASIDDPCQKAGACDVQSDPSIEQFLSLQGGNPNLEPEKSTSFTYGAAYSKNDFNAKIDYFSIETKNAIATNAQFIVDQFRENGLFADKVKLDANNNITEINAIALNLASRKVEGIDMAFDYALPRTATGTYRFNLMGSHYIKYLNQADKSEPFQNIVGTYQDASANGRGSIPKWKGLFDTSWTGDSNVDLGLTANYVSALATDSNDYPELGAWTTFDLRTGYTSLRFGKFTVGVNNLTDKKPPVSDAAPNDNIDARTHNLIGRFYYARWGVQL